MVKLYTSGGTMEKIVVLTGAGISAESGMGTFRDEGGLWSQHRIEDVATPEGFARDPVLVHGFYNKRRAAAATAEPNAAHRALAQLQRDWPGEVVIVTQNVDGLHGAAHPMPARWGWTRPGRPVCPAPPPGTRGC